MPKPGEVSREILTTPGSQFWRSWSIETQAVRGRLETSPFIAPPFLSIPLVGYPRQKGIALYLELMDSGERIDLAAGDTHENWYERILWLPDEWSGRRIRLVADSQSTTHYVGVGTPFQSSLLGWLKESVFVTLALHALGLALLLLPGLAGMVLLRRLAPSLFPAACVWLIPAIFVAGYAAFFLFYYLNMPARAGALLLWFVSIIIVATSRRYLQQLIEECPNLRMQFKWLAGISLFYVLAVYSMDSGVGSWAANFRFDPVAWSSDNQLQQWVAEGIYTQTPVSQIIGPGWRVSDRPPLLAGWFLLVRPLLEPLLSVGNNARIAWMPYQIFGIIACTLWIVPAWDLMRRLSPTRAAASVGILLVSTTGFALFNSVYIWPKMLAAYFGLLAYDRAGLWGGEKTWRRAVESGIFVALAMLSHGGVVFGFVGFFSLLIGRRWVVRLGYCTLMFTVFALMMVPWTLWQKYENPPGNTLIKYALTGSFCWGEDSKSVLESVRERYQNLTVRQWLAMKSDVLKTLVKNVIYDPNNRYNSEIGRVRLYEAFTVVGAIGIGHLGWPSLLAFWDRRSRNRLRRRCLVFGLGGVLVNCLFTLYEHLSIPVESYLAIFLLLIPLFSALTASRLRIVGIPLHVFYFCVVWVISPFAWKPANPLYFCVWMAVGGFLFLELMRSIPDRMINGGSCAEGLFSKCTGGRI
ncbi:MAG: hypothetical protein JXB10_01760 [Pirellulales bacterium]|nr:hypothetical protein [Pirellulales bacterium]